MLVYISIPNHFKSWFCRSTHNYHILKSSLSLGPFYMLVITIQLSFSFMHRSKKQARTKLSGQNGVNSNTALRDWVGSSQERNNYKDALRGSLALSIF